LKLKKIILNLTQHPATPDQIKAGVIEPDAETKERIKRLLTFDKLPTYDEILNRAEKLAIEAMWYIGKCQTSWDEQAEHTRTAGTWVMIGGAPYLMAPLEQALKEAGLVPVYAFSKREVVEQRQADGSVRKVSVFKHLGFIEVPI